MATEEGPCNLKFVPDHFKTQEICDKAVRDHSSPLQYVPDWFVTREGVDMWHDDNEYCDDDDEDTFFKWYDRHKIDGGVGVSLRMKKGIQKHCRHKHGLFLYLVTRYKNFLTQKE